MRNFFPFLAPAAVALTLALVGCSGGDKDGTNAVKGEVTPATRWISPSTSTTNSTLQLTYRVTPADTPMYFYSSNESRATVDANGLVTAGTGIGPVNIIYATSGDNEGLAKCALTVSEPVQPLSVRLTAANFSGFDPVTIPNGATVEIPAIIAAAGGNLIYNFTTSPLPATVANRTDVGAFGRQITMTAGNSNMIAVRAYQQPSDPGATAATLQNTAIAQFNVFPVYGETWVRLNTANAHPDNYPTNNVVASTGVRWNWGCVVRILPFESGATAIRVIPPEAVEAE